MADHETILLTQLPKFLSKLLAYLHTYVGNNPNVGDISLSFRGLGKIVVLML